MRKPTHDARLHRLTGYLFGLSSSFVLAASLMVGCGDDPKGDPCAGVECDDGNECTENACNPASGACDYVPLADGAFCEAGACQSGQCLPISSVFPCSQQGILEAIAAGGGPHAFACEGERTVRTTLEIVVDNDVILDGLDGLTVDGRGDHRVFLVPEGVTAELRRFTVTGGYLGPAEDCGGGIKVADATLTLTRTTVTENEISSARGGAGICNEEGTLDLRRSLISSNLADGGDGAGVYSRMGAVTLVDSAVSENAIAAGGGEGSGIYQEGGTLALTRSVVSGNRLLDDDRLVAGIYTSAGPTMLMQTTVRGNGVGISSRGPVDLIESLVSGNGGRGIVHESAGGVFTSTDSTISENGGGGIFVGFGFIVLERTTVSGNTAGRGAGALVLNQGALRLTNSTVSGNNAELAGGGLHNIGGGEIWLINSTLSGNSAGESGDALYSFMSTTYLTNTLIDGECFLDRAPVLSSGHNLESPGDTCGLDEPTDQIAVGTGDLKLGPLADNGGPTKTHAPLPGSAAVDRISRAMCEASEDQRGISRPQGPRCDVGAVEVVPTP